MAVAAAAPRTFQPGPSPARYPARCSAGCRQSAGSPAHARTARRAASPAAPVGQRRRSTQPTNLKKTPRLFQHLAIAADNLQRQFDQRIAQQDDRSPASSASSGCIKARASACGFCAPAPAPPVVVLMRRNNSSMNRKLVATAPIATPRVDRAVEVADHRGVHQPEQRYGDIGKSLAEPGATGLYRCRW